VTLARFIVREGRLSPPKARLFRACWGFLGLLTTLQMIGWGYTDARGGGFFVSPWLPSLLAVPAWLHPGIIAAMGASALAVMVGFRASLFAALFGLSMWYVLLVDYFAFHHGWVLMALSFPLLALFGRRGGGGEALTTADCAVFGFKALLSLVYLFAAINKLDADFLSGIVLERLLMWSPLSQNAALMSALAWGSLAAEAFLAVALWIPKLRRVAFLVGLGLHLGIPLLSQAGLLFHLYFLTGYLLFVSEPGGSAPVLRYPEASAARWLERLDWLGQVDWRAGSGPLTWEAGGAPVSGTWRVGVALAGRLVVAHPVSLTVAWFYGVYAIDFSRDALFYLLASGWSSAA